MSNLNVLHARTGLTVIIALLVLLIRPMQVTACTCEELTLSEARELADVIFVGRAVEVMPEEGSDAIFVTFKANAYWKDSSGSFAPTLLVRDSVWDGVCGVGIFAGVDWVVFGYVSLGYWSVSSCLPTGVRTSDPSEWLGAPIVTVASDENSWGATKSLFE